MSIKCSRKSLHIRQKDFRIYLWREGCLFVCCVCFCLSHWDLPNHRASCYALVIIGSRCFLQGSQWIGVHQVGFINVLTSVGEFIEYWTTFALKIHLKPNFLNYRRIWVCFWYCWKSLYFNEGDLKFLDLRFERDWIFSTFCHWKFN
jgi:hypothetical protein